VGALGGNSQGDPAQVPSLGGPKAKAGLVGQTPRLGDLVDGDLKWSIDFRQIYDTLLDRWLGLPAETVLGRRFDHLPLLEA
jgi:uncharacterized protein (DUF1501 family)